MHILSYIRICIVHIVSPVHAYVFYIHSMFISLDFIYMLSKYILIERFLNSFQDLLCQVESLNTKLQCTQQVFEQENVASRNEIEACICVHMYFFLSMYCYNYCHFLFCRYLLRNVMLLRNGVRN